MQQLHCAAILYYLTIDFTSNWFGCAYT